MTSMARRGFLRFMAAPRRASEGMDEQRAHEGSQEKDRPMTPTQAKIEAFEEAKRIMSRNMGDATYAEELAEFAVEDIDREIVRLKKAETRFPAAMTGSHAQAHIADDYKDFTGFGT